jgi:tetratricopeptide (TPR) repeat protein
MKKHLIFSLLFGAALVLGATTMVQAQNAESYESLMKKGNEKYNAKDYISAKTYYEMALKQKGNDPTAKKKLDETVKKIQEDGARQEIFYAHLDTGDQFFNQQRYEEALAEYEQALKVFPDDKYVGGQAEAARAILKERQDKQDAFDTAMSQGETLLAEENFDAAIFQFETAIGIFPNDKLPKEKLAEAKQKKQLYTEKVNLFDKTMEEARQLGLRKNYEAAIAKLDQALELFPNDLQANTMKGEYQAAKGQTDLYNGIIAEADQLYENKAYKEAKAQYQSALSVVAGDAYATDMIARLDPLIAQQDAEEAARIAAEQEAARLAAEAEAARLAVEAEAARIAAEEEAARIAAEQEAARLAAEEAARIAAEEEAARLAAEAEAARIAAEEEAARQAALAAAAELQAQYDNAMNAGNQAMSAEKFTEAITHYQSALTLKPNDETATKQLAAAEKAENDRLTALRNQYNAFIKEGDANFKSNTFDKAIEAYTKAEELGLESYPTEMIARISEIIEQNKLYELNSDYISLGAGEARRFEFNKIEVAVRRSNYIIIKVRNPQPEKTFPMIVSFGGAGGKNGGFVLPIAATDEEKTFIFRIGAQYKWFSEDNTWIEIISENNPVEIGKVEVSRSN